MTDRQCPSCGGFCKKSGCERRDTVIPCKHFRKGITNKTAAECPYCEIEMLRAIEPMNEVAHRFAHPLALELECVLADRNANWDRAMNLIGEYRSTMNAIHERHSPTRMGEPLMHNAGNKPPQVGLD